MAHKNGRIAKFQCPEIEFVSTQLYHFVDCLGHLMYYSVESSSGGRDWVVR